MSTLREAATTLARAATDFVAALDEATAARQARAPATASTPAPLYGGPPRSGEGPCAPPFGRNAGQPLAQLETKDLEWYRDAVERSLSDPSKSKYAARNRETLADLNAELGSRV